MEFWKNEQIENYIIEFSKYYEDSSKEYFSGLNLPSKLTKDELEYFNSKLNLAKIVGAEKNSLIHKILKDNTKDNFSLYIIQTIELDYEVNSYDEDKATVFMALAKKYFYSNNEQILHLFVSLLKKGYQIKDEDHQYLQILYKKISKQADFDKWANLRFVAKLDNPYKLIIALQNNRELFTLLSIKMGKPIQFKFQNLLGVAVNGLQHYRESGDLILKAIDVFGQTAKIDKLDRKKGTFNRKRSEYIENKPIQNKEFEKIAKIIFPELKIAVITPHL